MQTETMSEQSKTKATEKLLRNSFYLEELRRRLVNRQPGNESFARVVANISDSELVESYLNSGMKDLSR